MIFRKTLLLIFNLFSFSLLPTVSSSEIENQLRSYLFEDYNKYVRPVNDYSSPLNVTIGLAVQNIESFNQIQETIELNIWLRKYWRNDMLNWNTSNFSIYQLTVDNNLVWTPDIELINAATIPDIYTLKGGMYLYPDGEMLWSMPSVYKFSCALQLEQFPFDTQDCSLKFGSWTYDNSLLSLKPHGSESTQIDVLTSFSHSEWQLESYYVSNYTETRECCGDKQFDINEYHFLLSRYSHYYKLNMGMTIALVIVSFIIMLIKPDNLSRTGTAVFIPLTILALQLTIADKIPVVGYYTLMDLFFLTCFITSMMVSIESGIIYAIITSKSRFVYNVFESILDFDKIIKRLRENKIKRINTIYKHEDFVKQRKTLVLPIISSLEEENQYFEDEIESGNSIDSNNVKVVESDLTNDLNQSSDFSLVTKYLSNIDSHLDENNAKESKAPEPQKVIRNRRAKRLEEINKEIINDNKVVDKNVVKVIEYNNENLSITYKEHLIFDEITRIFELVDNICRLIFPFVFFIILGVIFSYDN